MSLPVHRSILAVDIKGSTQPINDVMEELREEVYRLVVEALYVAGIGSQHYDPFTDRGDGLLVLLRPADDLPKPLLLSRLIPVLGSLLVAHSNSISPADQPRMLRLGLRLLNPVRRWAAYRCWPATCRRPGTSKIVSRR